MTLAVENVENNTLLDTTLLIASDVVVLLEFDIIPVDATDNKEASVLDISLVGMADNVDNTPPLDCELVNIIESDVIGICSLFEVTLTEDGKKEDIDMLPVDVEVTAIVCANDDCSLLDITFILLIDDVEIVNINVLLDTEALNVRVVC